ncbi:MAG: type 1 glutamine amidotransferase [Methanoregulaceae archaeon]|jgi:GMP synthase-like glutamine amidotransferase
MNHVVAFQHSPHEPLGYIEQIFSEWDVSFEYNYVWETNEVDAKNATHLIFLGGPMSVKDEAEFPWLQKEKEVIRKAVKKNIPILGVCLGAQLIASAHGAKVYQFVNETGWYLVNLTSETTNICDKFPQSFYVFQMHGETFEVPFGAKLLCTGERVHNQMFELKSALAMQFHLEMTDSLINDWTKDLPMKKRERILRDTQRYVTESNTLCSKLMKDFLF